MKSFRYFLVGGLILFPCILFADVRCSSSGYTITTINGVLTNEQGARDNMVALSKKVGFALDNEVIDYQYLLNPSHLAGLGDFAMTVYQKAFENETVQDYDLIEMLNDASQKVKTQKLLLVAHSQGNFYANSFYDTVADQIGGVPKESIGVYSVANPASRVAGNGIWLTSDTDKVIATTVGNVPFKSIKSPNVHIVLQSGDDFLGHNFAGVYLKYQSAEIVKGIQESLDKLSSDPERREDTLCIDPPKLTIAHKIEGVALVVTDTALATTAGAFAASYHTYADIAVGTYHVGAIATVWTYNAGVATAVWTYDTAVATVKVVTNTTVAAASTVYNAVTGALSSTAVAGSNSAAVILATQAQTKNSQVSSTVSAINKSQTTVVPTAVVSKPTTQTQQTQPTTLTTAPSVALIPVSAPKLIFVGSFGAGFGGGGGAPPQVLGTQATTEVADEATAAGGSGSGGHTILPAPAISAPQCAYSLATSTDDGCLLATTTVRFEWTPVSGVAHYSVNKNGAYATTTEIGTDITAPDFSDYTFEVSAVDAGGYSSATSTQTVSVATIPIAINEIAWMGTVASTSAEWIEIKNNTGHTIDLSQWALASSDSKPFIVLTGTIAPREYRVLERWLDATVANVTAGQVYGNGGDQWALGNNGEQLNLSYASTTLDQTPSGAWVAGYNSTTTRKTMERYSSREFGADASNWGTNLGYIKNGTDANGNAIDGTPGAQNSVSTLINKGQDISSDFTLTDAEERYVMAGSVSVSASSTLTVDPGVNIYFYNPTGGRSRFNVYGAINVLGTTADPVTFTSFTGTPVGSVELYGKATSTATSAHFDTTEEGINVYGGMVDITDSSFDHIKYEAIGVYSGASAAVSSTTISNILGSSAIYVSSGSSIDIASTTIDGVPKGSGIVAYNSTLSIASSTIENVRDSGIDASKATSTISNTVIENAGWNGIEISRGNATITDTTVSGVSGWAGISVYAPVSPVASVTIAGGEVTGNTPYGVSTSAGSVVLTDVSVHDNGTDYKVW